jgi:NAD(P)-dependent dehydrogenase (short-subunit alcohol dehydrogenase family)
MDLHNRVVLLTGGKRVGSAVAVELARRGADLALSYRESRAEAETTASAVRAEGRRAFVHQADVSRPEDCDALVAATIAEFARLDVLVNMASVYRAVPFDRMTADDFQSALDVDRRPRFSAPARRSPHMAGAPHRLSPTGAPAGARATKANGYTWRRRWWGS